MVAQTNTSKQEAKDGREYRIRRRLLTTRIDHAPGRVKLVTQYNRPSGSDVITDELEHHYDGWGNLSMLEQDHDSAVGASGLDEYQVTFSYAKSTSGGRETLRRTGVTYPDSTAVTYEYLSTGDLHDDDASRVTRVKVGATVVAFYDYLGSAQLVGIDYDEVSVYSRRFDISGSYSAKLDRFNRPIEDTWSKNFSGTETHYYHHDIAWDRNSNITAVDDQVFPDQFVSYALDDLNRLTDEQRRSASGGGGSLKFRNQRTLSQVGNTTNDKLDLNGDTDQLDGGEWNDTRGFNEVNELLGRNLDSSGISYDSEPVYNGKGELTDDDESNLFDYDYWGRPRKVKNKVGGAVVSEYKYNGLGWRISYSDESTSHTYHLVYDDRWRNIATYIDSDDPADPKERMVYDNAGMMGYGGASYIDSIVLRDKDANTAWTSASDGTLEERLYLLQNWRSDVVFALEATGSGNGEQVENVRYEAYGIPTTLPAGDTDRDGDTDASDVTQIDTWISGTTWAARGDLDLDNDVDAADKTLATAMSSANGGRHILSDRGNRKGYAGYEWDEFAVHDSWQVRHRMLDSELERFCSRGVTSLNPYFAAASTVSPANAIVLSTRDRPISWRPGAVPDFGDCCDRNRFPDPPDINWCHDPITGRIFPCYNNPLAWTSPIVTTWFLNECNEKSWLLAILAPHHWMEIVSCRQAAVGFSRDLPGQHGGYGDARRHCRFSCCLARKLGCDVATYVLLLHEACGQWDANVQFDANNNCSGFRCANAGRRCEDCCDAMTCHLIPDTTPIASLAAYRSD